MLLVENRILNKEEVSTVTSIDVAETFGKRHADVLRDIRELNCSDDFRQRNFAQSEYINAQNHKQPMYFITRDGFTLLVMGYNGEKAMKFKEAYILQFNAMEKVLKEKLEERAKGIVLRQTFTKSIQMSAENERMHGHAYSTYTDIVYKTIFGKSAKQFRDEFGIDKSESIRDRLTKEELSKVSSLEDLIASLIRIGWGYSEIKEFLSQNKFRLITCEGE